MSTNIIRQPEKRDKINSEYKYSVDTRVASNIDIESATPVSVNQPTTTSPAAAPSAGMNTTPTMTGGGSSGGY